jgi:mannose-6-phosphate isomerase
LQSIGLSECFGLAGGGALVVNALSPDLGFADSACRLWPNAERFKAHIIALRDAADEATRKVHVRASIDALRELSVFLNTPVPGL